MPAVFDHVTLQVADVAASVAFYERLLAPLDIAPGHRDGGAVGFFGPTAGSFWLCPAERPDDRELHLAFTAATRDAVHAFFQASTSIDAPVIYEPQLFPQYDERYFAAFVRDPDGHSIEAVCRT
jgi:catechol 2,3-dioxygenase-like lactoylglutathione lyase family enzyme